MELLPKLAELFDVSLDRLMGLEQSKAKRLNKELNRLLIASFNKDTDMAVNELRILDVYEELCRITDCKVVYLSEYFHRLMNHEQWQELILRYRNSA